MVWRAWVIVTSHFIQVAVGWRVLAGIGYLVLSYLWYLSLRRNDPSVSVPFGALMGAGYAATICLGLAFAAFVPVPALVIGYMLWAWAASSYAGTFAFRNKEGNRLEMLAVVIYPHIVVWGDWWLRKKERC